MWGEVSTGFSFKAIWIKVLATNSNGSDGAVESVYWNTWCCNRCSRHENDQQDFGNHCAINKSSHTVSATMNSVNRVENRSKALSLAGDSAYLKVWLGCRREVGLARNAG